MNNGHFDFKRKTKLICLRNTFIKMILIPFPVIISKMISILISNSVGNNISIVVRCSINAAVVLLFFSVFNFCSELYLKIINSKIINIKKSEFIFSVLSGNLDKLNENSHGTLIEILNKELITFLNVYMYHLPNIIVGVLSVVAYLSIMLISSPIIGISIFALGLLQIIPAFVVKKALEKNYDKCSELEAELTDYVSDGVKGFDTIKLFDLKKWWIDGLVPLHKRYLDVGFKSLKAYAIHDSLNRFIENVLKFGCYVVVGVFIIFNICDIEIGIQDIYLSGGLYSSIAVITRNIPNLFLKKEAEKRIENMLTTSSINSLDKYINEISLKNVNIVYDGKKTIENLNYTFINGDNYSISGNNGSGKTSLLNCISRIIYPSSGTVCIDGDDNYNYIDPSVLLYIPQVDASFSFTSYELFSMLEDDIAEKSIDNAERFGIDKKVIENVAIKDLSGGERKKLFLSIAFAYSPQWLMLDEPYNNLDPRSCELLTTKILRRKNVIIINHYTLCNIGDIKKIRIADGKIFYE
ncbi:ABC transporter ATP-binding protein [Ruminococcus sp.]|uniref:ABC transporter ATP-binding protein n=1 Tax=Ruminococcus sp. TaxID=41978 RepID=UPI0025DDA651|nr:ABC transporter ATP-binding protein [Ruminococcus sp.]MBR1433385.1 ABC transporter ATP-binding protein [Ruminococcus sp.]